MRKNKRGLSFTVSIILFLTVLVIVNGNFIFAKNSVNSVIISGYDDGDIEYTVEELKKLSVVSKEVISVTSSGSEKKYSITGALLDDLLKTYGKSQRDLKSIRLIAGDGYSIEVPEEILKNRDIILAYNIDGKELDEKTKPVRVIIPEERSMYWIRNMVKIEIIDVVEKVPVKKISFLETIVAEVESEDYTYYESVDKAVSIEKLIQNIAVKKVESIYMMASDGLCKNEDGDIFYEGYIKINGIDAPMFLSPDLPKGMFVKKILYFTYGNTVVVSFLQGLEVFEKKVFDDKEGISVVELLEKTGIIKAESYRLTADDGYSIDISVQDLANGIIYQDSKGRMRSYFSGLQKNTSIKGLLSIEALD